MCRTDSGDALAVCVKSPNHLFRDRWTAVSPRDRIETVYEVVDPLIEHVQWMYIKKFGLRSLDRLSLMIYLKMALAEFWVGLVLMPAKHELPLGFDPLDLIEVMPVVGWKIK